MDDVRVAVLQADEQAVVPGIRHVIVLNRVFRRNISMYHPEIRVMLHKVHVPEHIL